FVVVVTATDTFGDATTATASVVIGQQPRPNVTISASANPTVGTPTTFTIAATPATGSTASIASIAVDFGDGSQVTLSGNATSVQHVYTSAGTFTATAVATDTAGASGSASTVIAIGSITVGLTSTQTASGGTTTVAFTATVNPTTTQVSSYFWDFGDG